SPFRKSTRRILVRVRVGAVVNGDMVGTGGLTSTSSELASLPASCMSCALLFLNYYFNAPCEVVSDYIAHRACRFASSHQRYDLHLIKQQGSKAPAPLPICAGSTLRKRAR